MNSLDHVQINFLVNKKNVHLKLKWYDLQVWYDLLMVWCRGSFYTYTIFFSHLYLCLYTRCWIKLWLFLPILKQHRNLYCVFSLRTIFFVHSWKSSISQRMFARSFHSLKLFVISTFDRLLNMFSIRSWTSFNAH